MLSIDFLIYNIALAFGMICTISFFIIAFFSLLALDSFGVFAIAAKMSPVRLNVIYKIFGTIGEIFKMIQFLAGNFLICQYAHSL